jgi:hypothetical protein
MPGFPCDIASARYAAWNGELLDLAWCPIDKCLTLPIADITELYCDESKPASRYAHRSGVCHQGGPGNGSY